MDSAFEEIDHTADLAIRVWGSDITEVFANAALGMASQMVDPDQVDVVVEKEVEVYAEDLEALMVEWLGELLYLSERERVVFSEVDVLEVRAGKLRAVVRGGPVDEYHGHIKAVTFSQLEIRETNGQYETIIVFDV